MTEQTQHFINRMTAIRQMLSALQDQVDDHFGVDPDAVHWGNVGDLGRVQDALSQALDVYGKGDQQ